MLFVICECFAMLLCCHACVGLYSMWNVSETHYMNRGKIASSICLVADRTCTPRKPATRRHGNTLSLSHNQSWMYLLSMLWLTRNEIIYPYTDGGQLVSWQLVETKLVLPQNMLKYQQATGNGWSRFTKADITKAVLQRNLCVNLVKRETVVSTLCEFPKHLQQKRAVVQCRLWFW